MFFAVCVLAVSSFVTFVLFSPSNVSVLGEVALSDSDCEFGESQTFSLSRKREAPFVEDQEDMNIDGTPVKTHPVSRKKIRGTDRIRR